MILKMWTNVSGEARYYFDVKDYRIIGKHHNEEQLDKECLKLEDEEEYSEYEFIDFGVTYNKPIQEYAFYKIVIFDSNEGKKIIVTDRPFYLMNDSGKTVESYNKIN